MLECWNAGLLDCWHTYPVRFIGEGWAAPRVRAVRSRAGLLRFDSSAPRSTSADHRHAGSLYCWHDSMPELRFASMPAITIRIFAGLA